MSQTISTTKQHEAADDRRVHVTTDTNLKDVRTGADAVISPDGKHAAFVVSEWLPETPKARSRIWIADIDVDDGNARPFSQGKRGDSNPCWSPDGSQIAFVSKEEGEEGKPQLYVKSASDAADEGHRVCFMPNGIKDIAWSPDGSRISFLSVDGEAPGKDPKVITPQSGRHRRLWTVRITSEIPEPVTPDGFSVWQYAWSPDGKQFGVYFATGPGETDWFRGQIGIVPAGGGAIRQVTQLMRQACALAWSPDGKQLAYISDEWSDPDRGGGEVFLLSTESGEIRNLTPGIDCSINWLRWYPDGQRILFTAWKGVSNRIGVLDVASRTVTPIENDVVLGDRHWPHLSITTDMQHFVTTRDERHPADAWYGKIGYENEQPTGVDWRRLSHLNPILEETLALAPSERIRYESVDGWQIDAIFTHPLPRARKEDGPPPLVVNVHGGPSGAWSDNWDQYRSQMLAAAGFAVLRANIRGSMGGGVTFSDAVIGDGGGKDFQDLMHGIDYLIERGLVDGNRLGIMGWSYGGFMTAWAVTQTTRFKAAVMGAGVCDFHSFHAQTNIPDWDMRFLSKTPISPLEHPDIYRKCSAITYANRVVTPTLIAHGEQDDCVPINQGYAFYRALQERNVPVEMVVYPREGHGLSEYDHIRDYQERFIAWFEKYL
jgi:dipeptidyl aminopeptidase/acylaminoacyl peptidase